MAGGFDDENAKFRVLMNEEEQYSLWLDGMEIPRGWKDCGISGDKKTCLEYVGKVWTDMRPKSLRTWMEQHANQNAAQGTSGAASPAQAGDQTAHHA
jgi:MbtH protein